uniref:Leucine-rich single-pass membrane protein 1 n=1 Tax=Geotrypetes seraphini TaxID=260995 RepID=A0A6P8SB12_GEOSA|nr:leucine-rich single-pass membrane protein 1 [Geotrypetes seraphini]XP_033815488.1 leucine-rich single-pass membrane protein 1 [Geotrypetes seraphini]XP_033815489.1 leucine-rich single-pass membrane protein 1 [Geotrypetes seraphini]XP_033815490.1 leucine-rich single-pass membrane protein 1 [Geotrypetes seraphini]
MNTSSLEIDFLDFSEEGKLYAVDSLNNLNKLNLCTDDCQDHLNTQEGMRADESILPIEQSKKSQYICFLLFITALVLSLALASFAVFQIIQTRDKMDEVYKKVISGGKDIEELYEMNSALLKFFNQTGV